MLNTVPNPRHLQGVCKLEQAVEPSYFHCPALLEPLPDHSQISFCFLLFAQPAGTCHFIAAPLLLHGLAVMPHRARTE